MFFTQNDYKKIQQWLIKNSVKDTEFNEANIPFNGEETITIVQGNQNRKVFLKDLIAQVFNLGISDFVNITDKYDAPNISLEEAIRHIPSRARKEGQVITFLDREDHWHIYQFKGALNQWNVLDTWEDLFDWEKLIINSILPDEEDLTKSPADENGNSYLSLKDREYNPNDFSGLGRIILRKNIVEIEDPVYGKVKKNVLYQDMFTQSNTIYEIRYDFDLNGQEITIPEGCVLDLQGGRLDNGTIVGNNTKIKSGLSQIFTLSINFDGTWNVIDAYPEWFGGYPNKGDCSESINKTLNTFNICMLSLGIYYIKSPILINKKTGQKLIGKGINATKIMATEDFILDTNNTALDGRLDFCNAMIIARRGDVNSEYKLSIDPLDNIEIANIYIDGANVVPTGLEIWSMFSCYHHIQIKGTNQEALLFRRGWNNSFNDIYCYYNNGDGIVLESECNSILLNRISVAHANGDGLRIESGMCLSINSLSIESCKKNGIKIINRTFADLERYGAYRTHTAGVNIFGLYMEANCESIDYANIYVNGTNAIDQTLIRGVFINGGKGRPLYISGTIRKYFTLDDISYYGNINSYIGYIIGQRKGNESNITLGLDPSKIDYSNSYESKQVAFISNSPTGSKSFNGINIGVNDCQLRSAGDLEFIKSDKILRLYTTDTNKGSANPINFWKRYSIKESGLTFEYYYSNGFIMLYVNGTATERITKDISASDCPFSIANIKASEKVFEVSPDNPNLHQTISTRDYNSIYVNVFKDTTVDAKIFYPSYNVL